MESPQGYTDLGCTIAGASILRGFKARGCLIRSLSFNAKTRLDGVTDGKIHGFECRPAADIRNEVTSSVSIEQARCGLPESCKRPTLMESGWPRAGTLFMGTSTDHSGAS